MVSKASQESSGLVKMNCSICVKGEYYRQGRALVFTNLFKLMNAKNAPCILAVGAGLFSVIGTISAIPVPTLALLNVPDQDQSTDLMGKSFS